MSKRSSVSEETPDQSPRRSGGSRDRQRRGTDAKTGPRQRQTSVPGDATYRDESVDDRRRPGQLKVQHSVDSADTAASGSSQDIDAPSSGGSGRLKSIWNRAVQKLTRKRDSPKRLATPEPIPDVPDTAEVDPVYSFLKLTADIPRQGGKIIPGDGHQCCASTGVANTDPTRCACPCHLPERLQECQIVWKQTFFTKPS